MIKLQDAESYLKKCLEDELGEDINDISKFWEVFKSFSKKDVGDDDRDVESGLLFECGISDSTDFYLGRVYVNFVRQFSIYEKIGGYSHMEQLICNFTFEPTDEISKLKHVALWYFFDEGGDLEEYFNEVENHESFKISLKSKAIQFEIYQTEV